MASSFHVQRREPEFICPASSTPNEYKQLSDIDSQFAMRLQARILLVYKSDPEKTTDPVELVRDGLARLLVFYYPLAGKLRECSDQKLVVECTGEGALFVEGDGDFSVEELRVETNGPAPYYGELIHDVPGSGGIIGCPLLLVQVTRLKCGGFVVGARMNHTLMDATGKGQLLKALAEMACGATAPSVLPVWQRELLFARDLPQVIVKKPDSNEKEYEERLSRKRGEIKDLGRIISRSFLFGSSELAALRRSLPDDMQNCSNFEVLTSFLWRSRAIAFNLDPEEEMKLSFLVDIRKKVNPAIPEGYYGNAVIGVGALTTAGALRENPLEYAVGLVRKAKYSVDDKLVHSYINQMKGKEKLPPVTASFYIVSDLTKMGMAKADFGWGKPAFVIIPGIIDLLLPQLEGMMGSVNYFTPVTDDCNGEKRVMVPMNLPEIAMERIARLIHDLVI